MIGLIPTTDEEFNIRDIENVLPQSAGMTLKDFWKLKMMQTVITTYGQDGVNLDKLSDFLDNVIAKSHNPIARMRNIYEERQWTIPLNNIPIMVQDNKLIIGANGTYTVNQSVKISEMSELLIKWLADRKKLKHMAIGFEEAGNMADAMKYDNFQNTKKEFINSSYGVSVMKGYILYSPDSASMITSQARELISEMLWSLEKLLGSNLCFKNLNEFYSFVNEITNINLNMSMVRKYNIKVPTFKMLTTRLKQMLEHVPEVEKSDVDNNKSLFLMLKNISKDPIKSINFYYKYNIYEFFRHNPKVMGIINWIMESKKEFNTPDLKKMRDGESSVYIEPLDEMIKIFVQFLVAPIPTYDRVDKYQTRGRYIIPISDTDSVMVRLDEWNEFVSSFGTVQFDTFYDEDAIFRSTNLMSYVLTEVLNYMGRNMARHCYVPIEYRSRIDIKNEFFFKSLLLYPNIKKNYSAWVRLREGAIVNKISNTGLALTGSNINPFVAKTLKSIISDEIHKVKDVSITGIMKRVYQLEADIRHKVLVDRNATFGSFSSFKNSFNREDAMSDAVIRGVEVWNSLYPDKKIENYNKVYVYNTILESEDKLFLIKDPVMREKIRQSIFLKPRDANISRYGLRTIAIPDGDLKYPEWLTPIVDVNKLVEKHVNSMTALLPSIGVFANRIKSNRDHISPLIKL